METVRVVSTYKDGKLVSNKKSVCSDKKPIYPDGLVATEALQHSLHKTLGAFDEMAAELYSLRRQLIEARREVRARTKERDSLRQAYTQQGKAVKKLERQKEDLQAKLYAAAEDLKHLEEAAAEAAEAKHEQTKAKPKTEKRVNPRTFELEEKPKQEKPKQEKPKQEKPRSIAASPVKK